MASADESERETDGEGDAGRAPDEGVGYRAGFRTQAEEVSDRRLSVEGALPSWLRGDYVANGPGQFEVGDESLVHWFDPLAMLRRFRFDEDGVRYANRFVRSRDFAFAREHGRVRTGFPGTAADRPPWTRLRQALTGGFPDNAAIGVQRLGEEYLAVTEGSWGVRFDPETLATLGGRDRTAGLDVDYVLGHLHYDPDERAFYTLGVDFDAPGYALYRRPDATAGRPEPVARLDFDVLPYVHSFALAGRTA